MQAIRYALLLAAAAALLVLGSFNRWGPAQAAAAPAGATPASPLPALENRVRALETAVAGLQAEQGTLAAQIAVLVSTPAPAQLLPTPKPALPPPAAADEALFEILNVDGRITESNNVWWKYAYIVELQNTGERRLRLDATIEFLDADGFVVDDDRVYGFVLAAGETGSMTGYALIDAAVAANVEGINAKVRVAAAE